MALPTYDPRDPDVRRDPYPLFAELRAHTPVVWNDHLHGWLVTAYDPARQVLTDDVAFSADRLSAISNNLAPREQVSAQQVLAWLNRWLPFKDAPDHLRIRRRLLKVFNPKTLRSMEATIEDVTDQLLDEVVPGQPWEVYEDFALRLPAHVVLGMLGVPLDHFDQVHAWSNDMMLFIGSARNEPDKYARAARGAVGMAEFFRDLIRMREHEPTDDVLSALLEHAGQDDDDGLSEDEIVASMMALANGAQDTTAHMLGNALLTLGDHPETWTAFRALPDDEVDTALEEMLRYDSPVLSVSRLVRHDTQLAGQSMASGDRIFVMLAAANRDPDVFDDPDRVELTRSPNPHLAFSKGAHFCLGAPVARLEGQIALRRLRERFTTISLAQPPVEIPWVNSLVTRGPTRLPVSVG